MSTSLSFIVLEGYLFETMEFKMLRGSEARTTPQQNRAVVEDNNLVACLLDKNGQVLNLSKPLISFPKGCSSGAALPGFGYLSIMLPRHPSSRRIELRAYDEAIFSAPIGSEPPPIVKIKLEPVIERSILRFHLDPSPSHLDDAQFFLVPEKGSRLSVAPTVSHGAYSIDLGMYAERGPAKLCLAVNRDFRTSEMFSESFALPLGTIHGRILEPRNNSDWSTGMTGSLIGNLFDNNGRAVLWDTTKVSWAIDTLVISDKRHITALNELPPGKHSIELRYRMSNGDIEILDRVDFHVREETAAQKEYAAVLAKYHKIKNKNATF
jgi:hypothetical protein